ncbi:ATP-binding protein [Streptomyces sp. NPDC060085]|uniref:ATP-binding protein n=1 Tax=Streptomyces sp. NPDC060085 TaxID=3347054 RepID=UPI00365FA38C
MTSAPPVTPGVPVFADTPSSERQDYGRPTLTNDLMSVCFALTPRRAGEHIAERDARRVRMVRRVTAARLTFCGLTALVDDVTLIVSELVSNAIMHSGGTQVTLTLALSDAVLTITVDDQQRGVTPQVCLPESDDERGRGLFLVDHVTCARDGVWGTSDAGATTWCSLPVETRQPT